MIVSVGILAGIGREAGSVHDEEILDVVGLLELVENRFFGIGSHARDARFVERPARRGGVRVGAEYFLRLRLRAFLRRSRPCPESWRARFLRRTYEFSERECRRRLSHSRSSSTKLSQRGRTSPKPVTFKRSARLENCLLIRRAEAGRTPVEVEVGFAFVSESADEIFCTAARPCKLRKRAT